MIKGLSEGHKKIYSQAAREVFDTGKLSEEMELATAFLRGKPRFLKRGVKGLD